MWLFQRINFPFNIQSNVQPEREQLVLQPKYCTKMSRTFGHFIYTAQCICYLKRSVGKKHAHNSIDSMCTQSKAKHFEQTQTMSKHFRTMKNITLNAKNERICFHLMMMILLCFFHFSFFSLNLLHSLSLSCRALLASSRF